MKARGSRHCRRCLLILAGALLAAVPIFILILIFGRRIVGSIQSSGVK